MVVAAGDAIPALVHDDELGSDATTPSGGVGVVLSRRGGHENTTWLVAHAAQDN